MDACVSKLIVRQMLIGGLKKFELEEIVEQTKFIAKVVRNEYLLRDPRGFPETIHHRIEMLQGQKEVNLLTDEVTKKPYITLNHNKLR